MKYFSWLIETPEIAAEIRDTKERGTGGLLKIKEQMRFSCLCIDN